MKAIKWIGPKQYTDFGLLSPGDIVHFGGERGAHLNYDLSLVAEKWVQQGYAVPYVEPKDEPVNDVSKKRKIKGGQNGRH